MRKEFDLSRREERESFIKPAKGEKTSNDRQER